jgi:hypothetical protein
MDDFSSCKPPFIVGKSTINGGLQLEKSSINGDCPIAMFDSWTV